MTEDQALIKVTSFFSSWDKKTDFMLMPELARMYAEAYNSGDNAGYEEANREWRSADDGSDGC